MCINYDIERVTGNRKTRLLNPILQQMHLCCPATAAMLSQEKTKSQPISPPFSQFKGEKSIPAGCSFWEFVPLYHFLQNSSVFSSPAHDIRFLLALCLFFVSWHSFFIGFVCLFFVCGFCCCVFSVIIITLFNRLCGHFVDKAALE